MTIEMYDWQDMKSPEAPEDFQEYIRVSKDGKSAVKIWKSAHEFLASCPSSDYVADFEEFITGFEDE